MIKKEFDWQTLPEIKYLGFLIKFDDDVEVFFERNKELTEVYERARASRMFFAQAAKETKPWRIGAYLRAGLGEFVSIEDAARGDWKKFTNSHKPPSLKDSVDPLIYMMYLTRNINVHAHRTKTRSDQSTVFLNDPKNPQEFEINIDVLDDKFEDRLINSRDALKSCEIDDLKDICGWIKAKQNIFGVGHLFRKGLSSYCRQIIAKYNKLIQPNAAASAD